MIIAAAAAAAMREPRSSCTFTRHLFILKYVNKGENTVDGCRASSQQELTDALY
jgi:hypothetical protein